MNIFEEYTLRAVLSGTNGRNYETVILRYLPRIKILYALEAVSLGVGV